MIYFAKISDEEQALQAGKIDAAIHDQPALEEYVKQHNGNVKIVQSFNTGEQYGFGGAGQHRADQGRELRDPEVEVRRHLPVELTRSGSANQP